MLPEIWNKEDVSFLCPFLRVKLPEFQKKRDGKQSLNDILYKMLHETYSVVTFYYQF